jgi:hypothetical protein
MYKIVPMHRCISCILDPNSSSAYLMRQPKWQDELFYTSDSMLAWDMVLRKINDEEKISSSCAHVNVFVLWCTTWDHLSFYAIKFIHCKADGVSTVTDYYYCCFIPRRWQASQFVVTWFQAVWLIMHCMCVCVIGYLFESIWVVLSSIIITHVPI